MEPLSGYLGDVESGDGASLWIFKRCGDGDSLWIFRRCGERSLSLDIALKSRLTIKFYISLPDPEGESCELSAQNYIFFM